MQVVHLHHPPWEENSESLLNRVFDELLLPTFGRQELDLAKDWANGLEQLCRGDEEVLFEGLITVLIENDALMGCIVYEFHWGPNLAMISYIVSAPEARGRGLGKVLATI